MVRLGMICSLCLGGEGAVNGVPGVGGDTSHNTRRYLRSRKGKGKGVEEGKTPQRRRCLE